MILVYQLKVGLCLVAFYLLWKLLLSRETLHRFNRVALLAMMLLAFLLPLVRLPFESSSPVTGAFVSIDDLLSMQYWTLSDQPAEGWNLARLAYIIYIVGGLMVLAWRIFSLSGLWRLLRKGRVESGEEGTLLHVMDQDVAPFSYFRHIVISEQDLRESGQQILTHEQAHIRLGHSYDVLLMDLMLLVQWWNPAAWLLKRELKLIHEYEADEAVLKRGVDARQYQLLLIRKSVGDQLFSMANNLNYQSLKKRIRMMTTKKSSRWQQLRALAIVPVAGLALVAFAQPEVESIAEQVKYSATLSYAVPADTLKKAYDEVEKMPEFPGGMSEMMRFVSDNIRYPKDAMEAKKEGRALVEFVIETDGSITDVSVVKEVYPSIDAEAIRVVKSMPKWTPGEQDGEKVRVKFTMPIAFKLQGSSEKETVPLRILPIEGKSNEPAPLFIVDGKEASYDVVRKIAPETIESLTVL